MVKPQLTALSSPEQRLGVANATLASVRLEGFEPSKIAREIMTEYVEGKITVDELTERTLKAVKDSVSNSASN